ncbi:hypothetical protein [Phormidium sp. CCY1219]|nr:hypothetical protein [Phormidium sp. CCY1219]
MTILCWQNKQQAFAGKKRRYKRADRVTETLRNPAQIKPPSR